MISDFLITPKDIGRGLKTLVPKTRRQAMLSLAALLVAGVLYWLGVSWLGLAAGVYFFVAVFKPVSSSRLFTYAVGGLWASFIMTLLLLIFKVQDAGTAAENISNLAFYFACLGVLRMIIESIAVDDA